MVLYDGTCNGIKNLKVSFYVLEDMIADTFTGTNSKGGFTIQLNGYSPRQILLGQPVGSYWMQYIFWIHGAGGTPTDYQIDTQVQYWNQNDPNVCPGGQTNPNENICLGQEIASGRTSNTIPKFWTFEIALNDSNGNITGATFTVTDENNKPVGTPATVSVPSPYQFPMVAFQVNVVGPDNLSTSTFTSGAGLITYESSGQLCVEGGLPDGCSGNGTRTGETSNANYGTIGPGCCGTSLTQSVTT